MVSNQRKVRNGIRLEAGADKERILERVKHVPDLIRDCSGRGREFGELRMRDGELQSRSSIPADAQLAQTILTRISVVSRK